MLPRNLSLWISCTLFLMGASSLGAEEPLSWRAAAGSVVITPEKPMWMAGYAARTGPSEGTEQDLFAKVLILQDDQENQAVIVTLDLIGIPEGFRDDVVDRCRDKFGLAPDSILLNASHTHCGPELRVSKIVHYGIDSAWEAVSIEYSRHLTQKIVDLIGTTLENLEPARLEYSHGRAGFAMNRRLPTKNGVTNSPYPDGPVDHDVPVLKVLTADNRLHAVLFGYACHNTTLSFNKFCGDYAGYAQEYLEAAHPGTTCLFMAGCGGDQNPYPRRTLDLAKQHGRALANAVETALEALQPQPIHGPLRVAFTHALLEFQEPTLEEIQRQAASSNKYEQQHGRVLLAEHEKNGKIRTEYPYPFQVLQFGTDLTLLAISGEVVVDYSLRLKQELTEGTDHPPRVWVAGYSNYVFGYLPSQRVLEEGGYEGGGAMMYTSFPGPFAPSVEDRVITTMRNLVDQTTPAVPPTPSQ